MLGGILRRLSNTGLVVTGFFLSECVCRRAWEDEEVAEDKEDGGWTLAKALLLQTKCINNIATVILSNDL